MTQGCTPARKDASSQRNAPRPARGAAALAKKATVRRNFSGTEDQRLADASPRVALGFS